MKKIQKLFLSIFILGVLCSSGTVFSMKKEQKEEDGKLERSPSSEESFFKRMRVGRENFNVEVTKKTGIKQYYSPGSPGESIQKKAEAQKNQRSKFTKKVSSAPNTLGLSKVSPRRKRKDCCASCSFRNKYKKN